jgi:hypothetical protein
MGNSNTHTKSTELSDPELMSQIINLLGEEEKFIQAITGLFSLESSDSLWSSRTSMISAKSISANLLLLLPFQLNHHLHHQHHLHHHHQLEMLVVQSHQPSLGKGNFFFKFKISILFINNFFGF